jgi:hypothetical protein
LGFVGRVELDQSFYSLDFTHLFYSGCGQLLFFAACQMVNQIAGGIAFWFDFLPVTASPKCVQCGSHQNHPAL